MTCSWAGITTMRLITNNPIKRAGLQGYGLEITGRIPIEIPANPHNTKYLKTKRDKFGHLLTEFGAQEDVQDLTGTGGEGTAR